MNSPKNPNKYSIDELLSIAETMVDDLVPVEVVRQDDIVGFIQTYKLEQGENNVPLKALYKLYSFWSDDPLKPKKFKDRMSDFFACVTGLVKLNESAITISDEVHRLIFEEDKAEDSRLYIIHHKRFEQFLKDSWVKEGTSYFNVETIYGFFLQWLVSNNKTSNIHLRQFTQLLDIYKFPTKVDHKTSQVHYGLDPKILWIFDVADLPKYEKLGKSGLRNSKKKEA